MCIAEGNFGSRSKEEREINSKTLNKVKLQIQSTKLFGANHTPNRVTENVLMRLAVILHVSGSYLEEDRTVVISSVSVGEFQFRTPK